MRFSALAPALAVAASLALGGCDWGTDPFTVQVGTLNPASIQVPESATVGQPFQVSFRTVGADGCWGRDRTEVSTSGMTATITPYDRILGGGGVNCTVEPVSIDHAASVTINSPGEARIQFVGRSSTEERVVTVR